MGRENLNKRYFFQKQNLKFCFVVYLPLVLGVFISNRMSD